VKIWLAAAVVTDDGWETYYVLIKTQHDLCRLTFATSTSADFTSAATDLCRILKKKTSKFHFFIFGVI
jgi:hypothetical protein